MDPTEVARIVVLWFLALLIPAGGYVGYRYAMMWLRRYEREGELLAGDGTDAELRERVERLELEMNELQERLDFAERLLSEGSAVRHLPSEELH